MNIVKNKLLILISVGLLLISELSYGQHAEIIINTENGNVIHETNATHSWFPASLTKLMTLYMTFDALRSGQIQLHNPLVASLHASRQPNSKIGLRKGETLSVEDSILALITRSANDAAVVLAEHIGGTEENFAVKMTAMAHSLGMYDTHFMNATGLPHQWQVTTARDMAILAWKTQRNYPNYYPYFASHSFMFKGRELRGINKFTASYPGAEGMKTGFTCGSGYNLISSATQNANHLIGVVLGGMTSAERYQLMISMMNNGFANKYPPTGLNITSMSNNGAGTPPYQLGCGNLAPTTLVSHDNQNTHSYHHPIVTNHRALHHEFQSHQHASNLGQHKVQHKNITAAKTGLPHKSQPKSLVVTKKITNKPNNSKTRYHHSSR